MRSLVLGNGNMLVCFDKNGEIRDFYFPYVGLENHIGSERVHKVGVWIDGVMSWISESSWKRTIQYRDETLSSEISLRNEDLGISLRFHDVVYNEKNILVRKVTVQNLRKKKRLVKLFFNQQFKISESTHAETAYYNPALESVVHYKGRRVFLVGGRINKKVFDHWSVGLLGIEGKEGTWKDAEDGVLSQNPIEHGSVDSVIGFSFDLDSQGSQEVFYWLAVGETLREVKSLQNYILLKGPDHLIETTRDFWKAWVNKKNFSFHGLSDEVVSLFKKSLLIIRSHCDNRGAILASGDSDNFQYGRDTYAYMWPRDGAFVATSLDESGYHEIAEKFFIFCSEVITPEGYVLHKYQSDRSLGSSWHPWIKNGKRQLAIQEDETALILHSLWEHYKVSLDLEFIEGIYNSLIKNAADFLIAYRDTKTGLPKSSYDLWEEKYGVSTFTASAVYGALVAASNFAELLGKETDRMLYKSGAESLQKGILEYLYDEKEGFFYKSAIIEDSKVSFDKTIDSSSFFGPFKFGVVKADDPRLKRAFDLSKKSLSLGVDISGIARYVGDVYYKSVDSATGNPWFLTTLWFYQYEIASAKNAKDLSEVVASLGWVLNHTLPSGIMSEQLDPKSGGQLSVSPLIWSHAEFVMTIISYLKKAEELHIAPVCFPIK